MAVSIIDLEGSLTHRYRHLDLYRGNTQNKILKKIKKL